MQKKRLLFVDMLRGWAILVMIEVHIFNSMLIPALKSTGWFTALNFVNGLVAPSFIFISGYAFIIASRRKIEEFRKFGFEFWRQLGRIFLIWITGYSIHLSYLSLSRMKNEASELQISQLFAVDVLQCIAIGLLILFLVRLVIRSDRNYELFLIISTVLILILSPLAWSSDFKGVLPLPLADYLNERNGSFFPLFPWLGFMFAGAVTSVFFLKARETGEEKPFDKKLLIYAGILSLTGIIVLREPFEFMKMLNSIKPNFFFFFLRVGLVLSLLLLCKYYSEWRGTEKTIVADIGRESFLVYWLHLQLMYRKFYQNKSLVEHINERLGVFEAIIVTLALIALMVAAAKIWSSFKKKYPATARYAIAGTVTAAIVIFLMK